MTTETLSEALSRLEKELASGDIEFPTFSDAEIATVTPLISRENRLVPLPVVDALDEAEFKKALSSARQSLVERGLVVVEGDSAEAVDELAVILEFRANPSAIVIIDHMARDGDDYSLYLYGIGSAGYLCEMSQTDEHAFTVRSIASVADMLATIIDPRSQASASDGPQLERRSETVPPGWEKFEKSVETTHTITRLSCSRKIAPDTVEDTNVSFSASEDGVWGYSGYPDEEEHVMYARALSSDSIRGALGAFLGEGLFALPIA